MKKLFFAFAIIAISTQVAVAQNMQSAQTPNAMSAHKQADPKMTAAAKVQAEKETQQMTQQLNLTEDQQKRISHVNEGVAFRTEYLKSLNKMSANEEKNLQEIKNIQYQKILTADQYSKYKASLK